MSFYKVLTTPDVGRICVATQDISPRQVVLETRPFCAVLCDEWVRERQICWFCFTQNPSGKKYQHRCILNQGANTKSGGCKAVYCSAECAKMDGQLGHSVACGYLQALDSFLVKASRKGLMPGHLNSLQLDIHWEATSNSDMLLCYVPDEVERDIMRFAINGLSRRLVETATTATTSQSPTEAPTWNDLLMLQNNEPDFCMRNSNLVLVKAHRLIYHFMRSILKCANILGPDSALFRDLVYREIANSFGIWDSKDITDSSELLGYAVFPSASFFNHCTSYLNKVMPTYMLYSV